jgi:hypothetical protein
LTLASGTVSPIDREVNAGTPIAKVEQFPPCRPALYLLRRPSVGREMFEM